MSAAHTFLQKNPKHEMTIKYLNYYKTMVDLDEYLVDLEAQPYEVSEPQGLKWREVGGMPGAVRLQGRIEGTAIRLGGEFHRFYRH